MLKKLIIAIVFQGSTLLFSQTGTLKGKIIDSSDAEELPFANVQLNQNGVLIAKAVADLEGNFSFKSIAPGKYEMKTAYVGYKSCDVSEIIVSANKTTSQNVKMESSAIMICDFVICEYMEPLIDVDYCTHCYFTRCVCGFMSSDSSSVAEKKAAPSDSADVECRVYPNPFMDYAIIELTSDIDFKWSAVQLFDLTGKKVREMDFSEKQIVLERKDLSAGTYVYRVNSKGKSVATGRIVVQ